MTSEELTRSWNELLPDFAPMPHQMKFEFADRWLRIHTLPEAKRYAETEQELDTILYRHDAILSDLFTTGDSYFLITYGYGFDKDMPRKDDKLAAIGMQMDFWRSVVSEGPTGQAEERFYCYAFFDELMWPGNSPWPLMKMAANGEIKNMMIFSPKNGFVYHPYDGGADIVFDNSQRRDEYKERYKDWLSSHPEGY